MTSHERVKKALTFDSPDRVPRDLWILPLSFRKYKKQIELIQKKYPLDMDSPFNHIGGKMYEEGTYVDEWGCKFQNIQKGVMGEVKKPLIKRWSDIRKVTPPYNTLDKMVKRLDEKCRDIDKFTLVSPGSLFERMQFLRGTPNLYMDIIDKPPEFFKLIDIVHEYNLEGFKKFVRTDIDGVFFTDDWGAQDSLLISPKLWRELFKPRYKEYCEIAHSAGKFVFMHSDGYIFDIFKDLIEIGINAINSQLFCMDIREISKRFKGSITFWGEIDRQHILLSPNVEDVRKAVALVRKNLYDKQGGVIAQCEFSAGSRPENVTAVFEEWEKS